VNAFEEPNTRPPTTGLARPTARYTARLEIPRNRVTSVSLRDPSKNLHDDGTEFGIDTPLAGLSIVEISERRRTCRLLPFADRFILSALDPLSMLPVGFCREEGPKARHEVTDRRAQVQDLPGSGDGYLNASALKGTEYLATLAEILGAGETVEIDDGNDVEETLRGIVHETGKGGSLRKESSLGGPSVVDICLSRLDEVPAPSADELRQRS